MLYGQKFNIAPFAIFIYNLKNSFLRLFHPHEFISCNQNSFITDIKVREEVCCAYNECLIIFFLVTYPCLSAFGHLVSYTGPYPDLCS